MTEFHFSYPVEIRYADLDPQGHVNNANFLSLFEHGRIQYLINLGLVGRDNAIFTIGISIAEAKVTYLAPVLFGMDVHIKTRVSRLGNKSLLMEYLMVDNAKDIHLARGSTILVTYDYSTGRTIPIPQEWREKIQSFESLLEKPELNNR